MKKSITVSELQNLVSRSSLVIVIDVRDLEEYRTKRLPFAGHLPLAEIEAGHFIPDEGKTIITVCNKGGGRSEKAANYLREHFANEVYFLEGGQEAWFQNKK